VKGDGDGVVVPLRRTGACPPSAATFSVKDVSDASGLPQPVVAQLVPRTDTPEGWMYTAEQLQYAIDIAAEIRSRQR
jgi:hypothetical protein